MLFDLLHIVPLVRLVHEHVPDDVLQFAVQFARYRVLALRYALEQLVYVRPVKWVITGGEIVPVNRFN